MSDWQNPSVAQQLLFATVRIETSDAQGNPVGVGSSFVLAHRFPNGTRELFLVSNKHVVEGGETGYVYFTRRSDTGGPKLGDPFYLRMDQFEVQWHGHPNPDVDVAVYPLGWHLDLIQRGGEAPYLMELPSTMLINELEMDEAEPLMPVVFVGYPNGLFDRVNYTPIVRQATLATPLQLDFSGEPIFLIDGSVFPGSSGSPVFSYSLSWKSKVVDVRLLGVISAVFTQDDSGEIEVVPAPTRVEPIVNFRQIIDLGVVVKASMILETLQDFGRQHGLNVAT